MIATPSKIYPKWDFWFENIASGNPGAGVSLNVTKDVCLWMMTDCVASFAADLRTFL
jgi:hypothetical protein